MKTILLFSLATVCAVTTSIAQATKTQDTVRMLEQVIISASADKPFLPDTKGVHIFAGKKTNIITLSAGQANLAQNNGRTIFAKIPGLNLWDMDGSGTQMNIGTRGTDAHRSIEMNMRQNGYNTNSDLFGYPENHYTVPMQAVRQVQLVRGSAALQFGSQFGGMMNYLIKDGDSTKVFTIESEQTTGSNNFFNSYNAAGGKVGKVQYYAYYDNRHSDGWRPNSGYNYQAFYASLRYSFSPKGSVSFQFSRMDYRQHIAGGLSDAQFRQNARQSNRDRNWFSPKINIPAIAVNYDFSSSTKLQILVNGIWGERSSVQFINTPNVNDTINTVLGTFNPRQVDRDFYGGYTLEARALHQYGTAKFRSTMAGGIRYSDETTLRRQKGKGTVAGDFDLGIIGPYGIDLTFRTINYAAYVENIFAWGQRFSFTPGVRYEVIQSELHGMINKATYPVSYAATRAFPLLGAGFQFKLTKTNQLYANISQAYRPYLYASITPADQIGVIDPNLKDSRGYDVDLGYRGQFKDFIQFDVNGFYLFYGNKIGKLTRYDASHTSYLFTTNIGNSVAKGIELYLHLSLLKLLRGNTGPGDLRLFTSAAYTDARYTSGSLSNNTDNLSIVGNRVEGVPLWLLRSGIECRYGGFTSTFLLSNASKQFNDANNTVFTATGVVGVVPSYALVDWALQFQFLTTYHISAGINNLANAKYFSRRINMYPGPGILPGDGRTFYFTLGCKF